MQKQLPNWLLDHIPEYNKVEYIQAAFTDSTHQLWHLCGSSIDQNNHFLKVCSNTDSPFWQIMHDLFDYDLSSKINDFSETYAFVDKACSLEIPKLIQAKTLNSDKAFILTNEVNGRALDSAIHDDMVRQLAQHLAELHSNTNENWGALSKPNFTASDWPVRLKASLNKMSSRESARQLSNEKTPARILNKMTNKWGGVFLNTTKSKDYLKQAIAACSLIKPTHFVPLIPDLRWDQFLQKDNCLSALVDLDAFVYAPRELDFVILEYLLSSDQSGIFIEQYTKHHAIPDIEDSRVVYRLLLFYMQILGEMDLDAWMNKESLF